MDQARASTAAYSGGRASDGCPTGPPYLRPVDAVREWLRFYRALRPLQDGFVLATFDEVTTDFGGVIACVNDRFNTTFSLFEGTYAR